MALDWLLLQALQCLLRSVARIVLELLNPLAVSCTRFRTVMCYPINCDGLGESEMVRTPSLGPVLVTIGFPIGDFIHSFLLAHCILLIKGREGSGNCSH